MRKEKKENKKIKEPEKIKTAGKGAEK